MASSTNYQWSEPDNTSLVKDGALAIRTLGNAIDTSLWNSGYGQAGKNKIINGDFANWQRGTTFTIASSAYTADRFFYGVLTAVPTGTVSQQTFTPGTAPVAGYESTYFARINQTADGGCTAINFRQRIEDVRTFAGQTATFSFYAKADAACNLASVSATQNFGSGGSGNVSTTVTLNSTALTTAWTRYTGTVSIPSVSGKTIGAGSYLEIRVNLPVSGGLSRNGTYDFWGWQVEYGSTATPFQTASGGSIQGELAMCQRYYYRASDEGVGGYRVLGNGYAGTAGALTISTPFPVTMRIIPTLVDTSAMATFYYEGATSGTTPTTVSTTNSTTKSNGVTSVAKAASFTVGGAYALFSNNTTAFLGFSAEL